LARLHHIVVHSNAEPVAAAGALWLVEFDIDIIAWVDAESEPGPLAVVFRHDDANAERLHRTHVYWDLLSSFQRISYAYPDVISLAQWKQDDVWVGIAQFVPVFNASCLP